MAVLIPLIVAVATGVSVTYHVTHKVATDEQNEERERLRIAHEEKVQAIVALAEKKIQEVASNAPSSAESRAKTVELGIVGAMKALDVKREAIKTMPNRFKVIKFPRNPDLIDRLDKRPELDKPQFKEFKRNIAGFYSGQQMAYGQAVVFFLSMFPMIVKKAESVSPGMSDVDLGWALEIMDKVLWDIAEKASPSV